MGNRLYVGNLSFDTTANALEEMFGAIGGGFTDVHLVTDRMTGRSRGFAFVTMATDEDANAAIEQLDGKMLDGRPLRVNEAREREPRAGGGGGGYGGGGGGGYGGGGGGGYGGGGGGGRGGGGGGRGGRGGGGGGGRGGRGGGGGGRSSGGGGSGGGNRW